MIKTPTCVECLASVTASHSKEHLLNSCGEVDRQAANAAVDDDLGTVKGSRPRPRLCRAAGQWARGGRSSGPHRPDPGSPPLPMCSCNSASRFPARLPSTARAPAQTAPLQVDAAAGEKFGLAMLAQQWSGWLCCSLPAIPAGQHCNASRAMPFGARVSCERGRRGCRRHSQTTSRNKSNWAAAAASLTLAVVRGSRVKVDDAAGAGAVPPQEQVLQSSQGTRCLTPSGHAAQHVSPLPAAASHPNKCTCHKSSVVRHLRRWFTYREGDGMAVS